MAQREFTVMDLRDRVAQWEQKCADCGSSSVPARLARRSVWEAALGLFRATVEEIGDATAGGLAPDEVAAPVSPMAALLVTACQVRDLELAAGE